MEIDVAAARLISITGRGSGGGLVPTGDARVTSLPVNYKYFALAAAAR